MQTTWQNFRNVNKFLEVVRYRCGHYYVQQFMQWGPVRNKTGRNRRTRMRKHDLTELLKDYRKIS